MAVANEGQMVLRKSLSSFQIRQPVRRDRDLWFPNDHGVVEDHNGYRRRDGYHSMSGTGNKAKRIQETSEMLIENQKRGQVHITSHSSSNHLCTTPFVSSIPPAVSSSSSSSIINIIIISTSVSIFLENEQATHVSLNLKTTKLRIGIRNAAQGDAEITSSS